jgi:hypothetical protein
MTTLISPTKHKGKIEKFLGQEYKNTKFHHLQKVENYRILQQA